MNYPPQGPHMGQGYRPQPHRQRSDYQQQYIPHQPPQYYPYFHQAPQYAVPQYQYQQQQQWYQPPPPPPNYPHQPRFYPQQPAPHYPPQPRPQPYMNSTPHRSVHTPQPTTTPRPEVSTPSTTSQAITSPSTTPTPASMPASTPPASTPKPPSLTPAAPSPVTSSTLQGTPSTQSVQLAQTTTRTPFYPQLPWQSVPDADFPPRPAGRRRRRQHRDISAEVQLPSRQSLQQRLAEDNVLTEQEPQESTTKTAEVSSPAKAVVALAPSPASGHDAASSDAIPSEQTQSISIVVASEQLKSPPQASQGHKRSTTKPVIPVIPNLPRPKAQTPIQPGLASPPTAVDSPLVASGHTAPSEASQTTPVPTASDQSSTTSSPPPATPVKAPPKSWAELFARGPAATNLPSAQQLPSIPAINGISVPKSNTLPDVLRAYTVSHENRIPFLEPRGLVNTGNMCYMNAILQVLVFCVPFYDFLDQVSKRVAHSFKSDIPLVEAMIMFMREFKCIDSAESVKQLRLRLKSDELEQYGDSFSPEYVYEVIKRLPRFSSMRRGQQQDSEEFLGFLLEGLHDECVHVMTFPAETAAADGINGSTSPTSERPTSGEANADSGWHEVGPKQKASVTHSSGAIVTESPVTKIFGGKLRSVLRIPGMKDSVTQEPYQPLQLDIGGPNINNITDALKGLTHSETLHGEFNSPRGPGTTATKQVFIDTLPPVLILHLKRFQYDNAGGIQKIWRKIGYPLDLELPKEVFPQHQRANLTMRPGGLPKYRLISAVYHHGKSAASGHYTVDVRRQEGQEWIRIDDTIIRRIRAQDVANEGSEEDPKLLAKALEQHKRDTADAKPNGNIYNQAFGVDGEDREEQEDQGKWSQVNGSSPTIAAKSDKKWSALANGATSATGSATPNTSTTGRSTPKASAKTSVKDNKVAYILFYQRV